MTIRKGLPAGKQHGMTLLEVLIALTILSFGLAGMAAMQLVSLQYLHSAHYRSLASTVALDLEERLWLELGDNSLSGCPSTGTESGAATQELIDDWSRSVMGAAYGWESTELLKIPDLTVALGEPTTGSSTTQVPMSLSWSEHRFSDRESTTEQFGYVVRIICRPSS